MWRKLSAKETLLRSCCCYCYSSVVVVVVVQWVVRLLLVVASWLGLLLLFLLGVSGARARKLLPERESVCVCVRESETER